ncbi:acyltransferase family protein [Devosia sp. A8/3-2]|nr:acyltransferase family protein [Devosia sp. A8/3-2]
MTGSARRLDWVDMAKGLSIFLVVMMYAASSVGEDTGGVGALHWAIAFATPFRMPEFFLISGLFLSESSTAPESLRRPPRRALSLFLRALGVHPHCLQDRPALRQPHGRCERIGSVRGAALWRAVVHLHAGRLRRRCQAAARHPRPRWAVFVVAAILQMASIRTGSYAIDQFAAYFVFFYSGYIPAPQLFRSANWASDNAILAIAGLLARAALNAALVFSPGFAMHPIHPVMGIAGLPGVHLVLALIGTAALCTIAALLTRLPRMNWLRWMGSKSLIIYVAFVLPMGIARTVLIKLGFIEPTLLSSAIMAIAIISPLILYWLVLRTGWGMFLFRTPCPGPPARHQRIAPGTTARRTGAGRIENHFANRVTGAGYCISPLAFLPKTHDKGLAQPQT